jgi:hypothetical protein
LNFTIGLQLPQEKLGLERRLHFAFFWDATEYTALPEGRQSHTSKRFPIETPLAPSEWRLILPGF